MAIPWYMGDAELRLAGLKAAKGQADLQGLASAIGAGKRGFSNYRMGGVMGVLDPEGERERQKAEQTDAELRARLGMQEDQAEAETVSPGDIDDEGYEFSGNPKDWLQTLGDLGAGALGAVAAGPGGDHRRSLVELARLRGTLAHQQDELSRARALSATIAGSTDPGAMLGKLAPSLGFGKGDVDMRAAGKGAGDPRSDWSMAWAHAREKYGREPTTDEVETELYRIKENLRAINAPVEKPVRASAWAEKREVARSILREQLKREPTEQQVWDFMQRKPLGANEIAMLSLTPEGRAILKAQGIGGAPVDPMDPDADDGDLDEEDEDDELLYGVP